MRVTRRIRRIFSAMTARSVFFCMCSRMRGLPDSTATDAAKQPDCSMRRSKFSSRLSRRNPVARQSQRTGSRRASSASQKRSTWRPLSEKLSSVTANKRTPYSRCRYSISSTAFAGVRKRILRPVI